jgi:hypothetical protein
MYGFTAEQTFGRGSRVAPQDDAERWRDASDLGGECPCVDGA